METVLRKRETNLQDYLNLPVYANQLYMKYERTD